MQMRAFSKITPSDPALAWTAKANKRVQFSYLVLCQPKKRLRRRAQQVAAGLC